MSRWGGAGLTAVAVVGSLLAAPVARAAPAPTLDAATIRPHVRGVVTGHDFPASTTFSTARSSPELHLPETVTSDATGHVAVEVAADDTLPAWVNVDLREVATQRIVASERYDTGTPQLDTGPQNLHYRTTGTIHVVATGYGADETLTLTCACTTTPASAHTDARGEATFDVRVSGPRRAKDLTLGVTGALSRRTSGAFFTLAPNTAAGPQEVGDLSSTNGVFTTSTLNGLLTVVETHGGGSAPWWTSAPVGSGGEMRLFVQPDGNVVLRDAAGRPTWQTRTVGAGANVSLTLQDDGNLVLRSAQGRALWASGTWLLRLVGGQTKRPGQALRGFEWITTMQSDGNLVQRTVYAYEHRPSAQWSSGTRVPDSSVTLQTDGNLVIRTPAGRAVWSTGTSGRCPSPQLVQQPDQNLVLRSTTTGRACWNTGANAAY